MNLRLVSFLLFTGVVFSKSAFAQSSPNAAALARYGEIPVNLFTGIPSIGIPLYELKGQNLSVPMSLSYHAGGHKVQDIPSWVGLGWALNVGGVITRSVRGLPDDSPEGYVGGNHGEEVDAIFQLAKANPNIVNDPDVMEIINKVSEGVYDGEPDQFYFNVGGLSGKFILNSDGDAVIQPYQNLKIAYSGSGSSMGSWTITDGNGIIYKFGYSLSAREVTRTWSGTQTEAQATEYVSSWYLEYIENAYGERVMFRYRPNEDFVYYKNVQTKLTYNSFKRYQCGSYTPSCNGVLLPDQKISGLSENLATVTTTIKVLAPKRIKEVYAKSGTVRFNPLMPVAPATSSRQDMKSTDLPLEEMVVYNSYYQPVKRIRFTYGYFQSTDLGVYQGGNADAAYGKRLRLEKVQEVAASGLEFTAPAYEFAYNTTVNLPTYFSPLQDIYGYYAANSTGQILQLPDVDPAKIQANILQSISYPSGSRTSFTFESNTVKNNPSDVSARIYGGLRIASILTSDRIGNATISQTIYSYNWPGSHTSGQGKFKNNTTRFSSFLKNYIGSSGSCFSDVYHYVLSGSNKSVTYGYEANEYIGYSYVLENKGALGVTAYKFSNYTDRPDSTFGGFDFFSSSINTFDNQCDPFVLEKPTVSSGVVRDLDDVGNKPLGINMDFARGLLMEKAEYKRLDDIPNNPVTKVVNEYSLALPFGKPSYTIGLSGFKRHAIFPWSDPNNPMYDKRLYFSKYNTRVIYLRRSTTTSYENTPTGSVAGLSVTKEIEYSPRNQQPKRIIERNGVTADVDVTVLTYPTEYEKAATGDMLKTLYDKNIVNQVIETVKYKEVGSQTVYNGTQAFVNAPQGEFILGGSINKFGIDSPLPSEGYALEIAAPVNRQNFKCSNRSLGAATWFYWQGISFYSQDVNYKRKIKYESYDNDKNLIQVRKEKDVPTSMIWGYNNSYQTKDPSGGLVAFNTGNTLLIANVVNATKDQIAHTSFEVVNENDWSHGLVTPSTTAKTGDNVYVGSTTLTKVLAAGKYKFGFWYKGTGTISFSGTNISLPNIAANTTSWVYYEAILTNPNALVINSGTVAIDEVRLHPEDAQMTTFTYQPLIGKTSETSPQQITTYYKYDTANRLKLILDQDRNILKKYSYGYKQ